MQTTSTQFLEYAIGQVRPLSWELRFAFDKQFDDSITFFTLDSSVLDGPDILASSDSNLIAQWDQYEYSSYSDRVISMEWQREEQFPFSVTQSIADVTLNNFDGYFTRGSDSPIAPYLLPKRPLRILAGFGGINLPQFVGLTTSVPVVDKSRRTASVHCIDFLSLLFDKPLDKAVVMQDYSTDEVLDELFQQFGLSPSQYQLDTGYNIIPFVYFEKGKKLGDAVKDLMEAELGSLYMDEQGLIIFRNRLHTSNSPVYSFDESNIIDYDISDESKIINVVEIKAEVRIVQPEQTIYTLLAPIELTGTSTTEFFFNFEDPVTSVSDVDYYIANTVADGSGSDVTASITVASVELFNTAVKIVFNNLTGNQAFITSMTLLGTPAKVARKIYLRTIDQDSIDQFDEQVMSIDNNFIQSDSAADSIALSLLNYYKDYANTIELTVKGNHALQPGDAIEISIDDINDNYSITKIVDILADNKFTQRLTAKVLNIPDFFILDQSELDGGDVLAP